MSMRSITRSSWTRAFVDTDDDIEMADRLIARRLRDYDETPEHQLALRVVAAEAASVRVYEFAVLASPTQLVTIEPGAGIPVFQDVEARLQWDEGEEQSVERVWFEIAQAGLQANVGVLALLEHDVNGVRRQMARIEREAAVAGSLGVSDLPRVSEMLIDIDHALSHVSLSINGFVQFARLLRRDLSASADVSRPQVDLLVQQGEALTRRLEFLVGRHRFHSQGASQQISTSDLNIVKIFTVLWAILIPGTTLINWYGQNFENMPELSWEFSSWIQILGVFCLAVLPIYTVKRAGQLR